MSSPRAGSPPRRGPRPVSAGSREDGTVCPRSGAASRGMSCAGALLIASEPSGPAGGGRPDPAACSAKPSPGVLLPFPTQPSVAPPSRWAACSVLLTLLLLGLAPAQGQATPLFAVPDHVPDAARDTGAPVGDRPMARTALLVDHEAVVPGQDVRVGVHFTMEPGWHIYWRNSGQSGFPTEVDLLADGDETGFGPLRWPAPRAFSEAGGFITTYGYGGTVLLQRSYRVPEHAGGEIALAAVADFLICEVDCIPAVTRMHRTLRVGEQPGLSPEAEVRLFDEAEAAMPVQPEERGWTVELVLAQTPLRPDDTVRAVLGVATCAGPPDEGERCAVLEALEDADDDTLIPDAMEGLAVSYRGTRAHPDAYAGLLVDLELQAGPDRAQGEVFSGVLTLVADGERKALEIAAALPRGARDAAPVATAHPFLLDDAVLAAEASGAGAQPSAEGGRPATVPVIVWWQALLLAMIGGMLLNLMPCVFPILAIKVYGLTELAHASRSATLRSGAAYTAGIVASMLLLGLAVVALRAGGTAVGWGFQFQEPLFIAAVGAVLVLFAANLFGAFEIGVSASRLDGAVAHTTGLRRSFFEGVLAVILATPCSAPFLGTAVGFALAGPALLILGIFAVLGLGLALPYVLLTLMPQWARWLPRPGPWMDHFRRFLGFVLLGTTVWLLWIVGQSTGSSGMTRLLIFLVACGLAAWLFGLVQHARTLGTMVVGRAVAAALIVGTGWVTLNFTALSADPGAESPAAGAIDWQPFDEDAIAEVLRQGQPAFVDFTADWCITCKFNERTVIQTERVREAIAEHEVVMFRADWTRRDDRIREVLARYGKAGVPMYLTYGPDAPDDPEVLPELLTADRLIASFARATGQAP